MLVAFNKAEQPRRLATARFAPVLPAGAYGVDILTGEPLDLTDALVLAPRSVRVIELGPAR